MSGWMGRAMLRFAARLDALGQRSVWYLPGGPGRDWATSRYREAADMALSLTTSSSKWQRRATKRRRRRRQQRVAEGVAVSMVSCQLVRASAANLLERHCENGAPERSRWDHAAGTDLEAPLAQEAAEIWRWMWKVAAAAVGYGGAAEGGLGDAEATAAEGGEEWVEGGLRGQWGTTMRPEALGPTPGSTRTVDQKEKTRRRMSVSGIPVMPDDEAEADVRWVTLLLWWFRV